MSFAAEEILSHLYYNPPEMLIPRKADITKSIFSAPGAFPKKANIGQSHSQFLQTFDFQATNQASIKKSFSGAPGHSERFPTLNNNTVGFPQLTEIPAVHKPSENVREQGSILAESIIESESVDASEKILHSPFPEAPFGLDDNEYPYRSSHIRAVFENYNLIIDEQQTELRKIKNNIRSIRKYINNTKEHNKQLQKLYNQIGKDILLDVKENKERESAISSTFRQNFKHSQHLTEKIDHVSNLTEEAENYKRANDKLQYYLTLDSNAEAEDMIEKLTKEIESKNEEINREVEKFEAEMNQKDSIIAELTEKLRLKNKDIPNLLPPSKSAVLPPFQPLHVATNDLPKSQIRPIESFPPISNNVKNSKTNDTKAVTAAQLQNADEIATQTKNKAVYTRPKKERRSPLLDAMNDNEDVDGSPLLSNKVSPLERDLSLDNPDKKKKITFAPRDLKSSHGSLKTPLKPAGRSMPRKRNRRISQITEPLNLNKNESAHSILSMDNEYELDIDNHKSTNDLITSEYRNNMLENSKSNDNYDDHNNKTDSHDDNRKADDNQDENNKSNDDSHIENANFDHQNNKSGDDAQNENAISEKDNHTENYKSDSHSQSESYKSDSKSPSESNESDNDAQNENAKSEIYDRTESYKSDSHSQSESYKSDSNSQNESNESDDNTQNENSKSEKDNHTESYKSDSNSQSESNQSDDNTQSENAKSEKGNHTESHNSDSNSQSNDTKSDSNSQSESNESGDDVQNENTTSEKDNHTESHNSDSNSQSNDTKSEKDNHTERNTSDDSGDNDASSNDIDTKTAIDANTVNNSNAQAVVSPRNSSDDDNADSSNDEYYDDN